MEKKVLFFLAKILALHLNKQTNNQKPNANTARPKVLHSILINLIKTQEPSIQLFIKAQHLFSVHFILNRENLKVNKKEENRPTIIFSNRAHSRQNVIKYYENTYLPFCF